MRVPDGRVLEVTEESEPELFRATLGGMGLTGHILEVQLCLERIPSPWIWEESERVPDIDGLVQTLKWSSREWPFTVAWADCLKRGSAMGRGIVYRGRWADPSAAPALPPRPKRQLTVPVVLPEWVLSPMLVRIFNAIRFRRHGSRVRRCVQHPEVFFYPLDAVGDWNRLYGRRGFTQYQCVLPVSDDPSVYRRFFNLLLRRGGVVFLCVVKDCGAEGKGLISFPRPGISITLDIPIRGQQTRDLVETLNQLVIDLGGRIYLAKDVFTRADHYAAMDPRLSAWEAVRGAWDPDRKIQSAQSVRLLERRE
jgi:FAD/FMN-containing dehydrogenase